MIGRALVCALALLATTAVLAQQLDGELLQVSDSVHSSASRASKLC